MFKGNVRKTTTKSEPSAIIPNFEEIKNLFSHWAGTREGGPWVLSNGLDLGACMIPGLIEFVLKYFNCYLAEQWQRPAGHLA